MADTLLAAIGREEIEEETEYVRARAGAMHIAEAFAEIRTIRRMLGAIFKSE